MKWEKLPVKMENLPLVIQQLKKDIQSGSDKIESMRCVFTLNDNIVHILMPYDFLDNIKEQSSIKSFSIYQALEN